MLLKPVVDSSSIGDNEFHDKLMDVGDRLRSSIDYDIMYSDGWQFKHLMLVVF